MTPLARTKQHLESLGWSVGIVEQWVSFGGRGGIRRDLFNVGDLIGLYTGNFHRGIWLIQVTTGAHHAERAAKINALLLAPAHLELCRKDGDEEKARVATEVIRYQLAHHAVVRWQTLGGRIAVISWSKQGERGKRKLWTPRFEELGDCVFRVRTAVLKETPLGAGDPAEENADV
jgi:hypothetical protein